MIGATTPHSDYTPGFPSPLPAFAGATHHDDVWGDHEGIAKPRAVPPMPSSYGQQDMSDWEEIVETHISGANSPPLPQRPLEEVVIAVMGATGSGKTTFINTVSGSQMRISGGLRSCTNVVQVAPPFLLDGRKITLVDTPGFDDTTRSDTDILKMIAHFLTLSYEKGKKLAGVIYIHRISDFRMGGISTRNFRMFRELCGDSTLKNVVVLTNMWGEVNKEVGEARERELANDDLFFKPVLEKGAKMIRHDHTLASAQKVMRYFFLNNPIALQIQREIVDEKKDILQTAAGEELNRELIQQMQRHKQEMADLQKEWQDALDAKDEETRREIEAEAKKLKKEMERVEGESKKLASNFQKEKEALEKKMREMDAEAKRDQQRMQEQYDKQMQELQRQRKLDSNQSEEMQAALSRQIQELRNRRGGGGWFSSIGRAIDRFFGLGIVEMSPLHRLGLDVLYHLLFMYCGLSVDDLPQHSLGLPPSSSRSVGIQVG